MAHVVINRRKRFVTHTVGTSNGHNDPVYGQGFDINYMPQGHLACPKCGCAWFAMIRSSDTVAVGCKQCSYEMRILLSRVLEEIKS